MKKRINLIIIAFFALTSGPFAYAKYQNQQTPVPKADLPAKVVRHGKASWYSKRDPGINRHTANMEIFDDQDMTCAMWGVPFNQLIKVTNRQNGKSVIVRVNDRGPHKRFVHRGRLIDLSKAAFAEIAPLRRGLIEIELEFL